VYPNVGNLLSVLRPWHDAQTPTPEPADLVFPYDSDYRNIYADWRRILEHAGLPTDDRKRRHRLKDLRSTCATQLIEAGEPTLVVKDWLGHATVKTTESYYANTDKARKAAAGRRRVAG
jgi:integrase